MVLYTAANYGRSKLDEEKLSRHHLGHLGVNTADEDDDPDIEATIARIFDEVERGVTACPKGKGMHRENYYRSRRALRGAPPMISWEIQNLQQRFSFT